eukprot:15358301-Ditylum_brightwellii.AAC.1
MVVYAQQGMGNTSITTVGIPETPQEDGYDSDGFKGSFMCAINAEISQLDKEDTYGEMLPQTDMM